MAVHEFHPTRRAASAGTPPSDAVAAAARRARRWAADALIVVGWLLFVGLWWRTLTYTSLATVGGIAATLLACVAVAVAGTATWTVHNLRIHRRSGPRRAVPAVEVRLECDFMGRRLDADWDAVRAGRYVLVAVNDGRKLFRPVAQGPVDADLQIAPDEVPTAGMPVAGAPPDGAPAVGTRDAAPHTGGPSARGAS